MANTRPRCLSAARTRACCPILLDGGLGLGRAVLVRNVARVCAARTDGSHGHHGTTAAIEYATLTLSAQRIVVCGHSHCGAVQALYQGVPDEAINLAVG